MGWAHDVGTGCRRIQEEFGVSTKNLASPLTISPNVGLEEHTETCVAETQVVQGVTNEGLAVGLLLIESNQGEGIVEGYDLKHVKTPSNYTQQTENRSSQLVTSEEFPAENIEETQGDGSVEVYGMLGNSGPVGNVYADRGSERKGLVVKIREKQRKNRKKEIKRKGVWTVIPRWKRTVSKWHSKKKRRIVVDENSVSNYGKHEVVTTRNEVVVAVTPRANRELEIALPLGNAIEDAKALWL
ncbi:hypothetical protein RIF29_38481 [Crotalaria pallida]|uniref:Uncharacterized protein n=1 Tax=Crotalaria pallida TaxID=3830 RepID=A0AAN9E1U4_CROPI